MRVVIVGCGIAGVTAAKVITEYNDNIKTSIYTDESHLYYPRPKLYEVLSGEADPSTIYSFPEQWYDEKGIKIYLDKSATEIETDRKELILKDRTKIGYDRLLLANGAHPFLPPVKGVDKKGVFSLRTIENTIAIREYARNTKRVIVIGGGLLGLEFASSLRKLGQRVEVVELFSRLLPKQLDQEGANVLKDIISASGIEISLGVKTQEILGKDKVSGIALDNGKQISGELVLFSAGIRSNTDLAAKSGIKVNRGVVVNQFLQTSSPDVYAAGDVCEFEGKIYGIIPAALDQAKIAAANLLGKEEKVYKGTVPSNTLKIAGIDFASIGLVNPEKPGYEEIKKVDMERGIYKKIVLDQGKIVGAIVLGETKSIAPFMKLIGQKNNVSVYKDAILEDDFDFRKVLSWKRT
jgi:nitrite reductase (NADH) large subunit